MSSESADDRQLLVAIEGSRIREDLHAHVGGVSVDVRKARRRTFVYESRRVLDGYVSKPVNVRELIGTVRQYCDDRD